MTYKENIERLRGRGRYNLNQRWRNANARINFIEDQEKEAIGNINKASDLLVGKSFGSTDLASGEGGLIPYKFGEYLTEQEKIGIEAEKADRVRKVEALEKRLTEVSDIDTAHLNVKQDMLINGYLYEDADRFAKLSPHAQVAYARRKLGIWKESVGAKLNYKLAKDNTEYTLKDWPDPLTPEKIHNDPNIPPVVKEAFVDRTLEDLIKENGINGFSKELLELEQINDYVDPRTGEIKNGAHSIAKKGVMDKYRTIYNVTSSQNQRIELFENFKSDKNLTKLISGLAGTLDNKEAPLGPLGAWQEAEKLFVSWLMSGDIEKGELYTIFDNAPSPIKIKGKKQVYLNSHRKRLQNIINEYARQKQLRDRANKITDDTKADAKKQESLLRLDKGGDLYNYLFEEIKIDELDFDKRAEIVNATLTNLQTDWIEAGGEFDTSQGATFAPWLADVYNDLVFTDQGELIGNATVKLNAGIPLKPDDLEGMNASSLATIQNHKNWSQNQGLIQKTALQYRKVTPSGEAGYELTIPNMVKSALKTAKRDDKNTALVDYLTQKNMGVFQAAWDEAWLDKSGTMTGNKAFNFAMGKVRYNLGLGPDAHGNVRKAGDVDKDLKWDIPKTEKKDITREANRGQYLADLLVKQNESSDENITEQEYWIPSLGPDSIEFKQLLAYSEGKGGKIPQVYNWIAGYMPFHTAEQLAAWQLAQVGKTLPTTSAVNEAMKLTEAIAGFNRLIGYKTNSTDLHQAKINAKDQTTFTIGQPFVDINEDSDAKTISDQLKLEGSGYSLVPSGDGTYKLKEDSDATTITGTPTTFQTTALSFDETGQAVWAPIEDNPMYMGNNLEGWLEKYGPTGGEAEDAGDATADISELEQVNFESDRLNTIYNEKGFHDEEPGPEPSLKDYPLQPGDERTSVIVNGIPTLAPYNEKAWQEDVNAWKEKKSLYRPLTKIETTGGRAKSRYTTYFNPETDTYEKQDIQDRLFPEEKGEPKKTGRERLSQLRQQKHLDARLERAAAQPDSKVVNVHRTDDGRYIQGPITVYKHVDEGGRVQYKLKPPGSASNLQSFWNIPGSPVLSPALQEYAMGLYNTNLQTA